MIHAPNLKELSTIEHGFGTRAEELWLGAEEHAFAKQVHGCEILEPKQPGLAGEGDALVTTSPELWIGIRTADCLPILLVDPVACVAAAVHAGWRGTAEGIVTKTLRRMEELGAQLTDIHAAIGPGICEASYEVGPEVAAIFQLELNENGKAQLDLTYENERQLREAGLEMEQIWAAKTCTKQNPELFHSFRRDGAAAGRMLSAIRLL
jgi:YfiH family protein